MFRNIFSVFFCSLLLASTAFDALAYVENKKDERLGAVAEAWEALKASPLDVSVMEDLIHSLIWLGNETVDLEEARGYYQEAFDLSLDASRKLHDERCSEGYDKYKLYSLHQPILDGPLLLAYSAATYMEWAGAPDEELRQSCGKILELAYKLGMERTDYALVKMLAGTMQARLTADPGERTRLFETARGHYFMYVLLDDAAMHLDYLMVDNLAWEAFYTDDADKKALLYYEAERYAAKHEALYEFLITPYVFNVAALNFFQGMDGGDEAARKKFADKGEYFISEHLPGHDDGYFNWPLAQAAGLRGDVELCMKRLEAWAELCSEGTVNRVPISVDRCVFFDPVRDDPQFKKMIDGWR